MSTHKHSRRATCSPALERRTGIRPRVRGDALTELVTSATRGEPRAWELLVGRFTATIRGVARRHGLCEADQEEVAQRTWLRLVEHIASIREPAGLGGWLVTTARRESVHVLASARREFAVDEVPVADQPDAASPEDVASEAERRRAVHRALDGLPVRQRTLMCMLLEEPWHTFSDLSAALGMPRGSIGPTYARSVARLRRDPHLAGVIGAHAVPPAVRGRGRVIGHDLG